MKTKQIKDIYRLTPTQEGMLFHALSDPEGTVYVEQAVCRVPTPSIVWLQQAFDSVIGHFDALRTAFHYEAVDQPVQLVHQTATLQPIVVDLSGLNEAEREEAIRRYLVQDRERGFDLSAPPLLRVSLLTCDEKASVLVWTNHHLILDGWSAFRVIDEVFSAYDAVRTSKPYRPRGTGAFKPYVKWLLDADRSGEEAFFREYLAGFTVPTKIPAELDSGASSDTDEQVTILRELPEELAEAVREYARRQRLTLNTVFQGAYAWLLSVYTGEADVVFGTTVSGRPPELPGVESMVGLFINTLPARVRLTPSLSVNDFLATLQKENNSRRAFEYAPLPLIQKWTSLPAAAPMFETLLAVETFPASPHVALSDLRVNHATNYKLSLVVEPGRRTLLRALYNPRYVTPLTVERLLERFMSALEQFVARPEERLGALEFSLPAERTLLAAWNRTARDYPATTPIDERFVEQVRKNPARRAVFSEQESLSYGELLQRADQLAAALQAEGAAPGNVVAMLCEPSADMIVAAVGITRAGCAYAPLDPTQPAARLSDMLGRLRARHLVGHRRLADRLACPTGMVQIELEAVKSGTRERVDPGPLHATDPLYVMHTSGSTGEPKAAGVYHHAFVNLMEWWNAEFGFTPADRVLLINRVTFDLTQKNFWGALMTGGEVHVVPDSLFDPLRVRSWISEHGITWMNCTPSMAHALLEGAEDDFSAFDSLRYLMLGGEPVQKARLSAWQVAPSCRTEVVNTYGPTESTDLCTVHRFSRREFEDVESPVSVGTVLPNVQLFVVDEQWRVMPPHALGEVVIGAASVGLGYLNSASMTATKFIPDFVTGVPGARLYRTGDIGCFDSRGRLFVRGRVDSQIKLRGQRIELEEIDATLRRQASVAEVVTVSSGAAAQQLVSYVVPSSRAGLDPRWREALRDELSLRLPRGWLPAAYVLLDFIPLNDNGKVDRGALPAPSTEDWLAGAEDRVGPRNEIEQKLWEIWRAVLKRDDFGVTTDFFELGGDSLSITQVFSRLPKAFGVKVPLGELFAHPTVAEQVGRIIDAQGAPELPIVAIESHTRPERVPLSSAQRSLWWLHQLDPNSPAYHVPTALRFEPVLDRRALRRALSAVLARHESLRTGFLLGPDGEPFQSILPAFEPELPVHELALLGEPAQSIALVGLATELVQAPFDLSSPPFRVALAELGDAGGILLVVMHHMITDGWSMGVFERELRAAYAAFRGGREFSPAPLPIQYADYAAWQRGRLVGEEFEKLLGYWQTQLEGHVPTISLPFDGNTLEKRDGRGGRVLRSIGRETLASVQAFAAARGVTLYEALLTGFQSLLYRLSGQEDFNVGTPVANRHHRETEGLIGMFVNTLVLRTRVAPEDTFLTLLDRTRSAVRDAQDHQDMPFERLVESLGGVRGRGANPLFQVLFSVQEEYENTSLIADESWVSRFDLQVIFSKTEAGLTGAWEYASSVLARETVANFAELFEALLASALQAPERRIGALRLCSQAESEQGAVVMEASRRPYPRDTSIESLFAEIAERDPGRVAVTCRATVTTYGELHQSARAVAATLIRAGVCPGDRVGVGVGRSALLVASWLGVLMAGAAYVPLDPSYPTERLRFMIADAGVDVVLTELDRLVFAELDVRRIDATLAAAEPDTRDVVLDSMGGERTAYVMYTSGTTGRPKGILVPCRGVVRLARDAGFCALNEDTVVLQSANVAFDASTFEVWGPLLNGGRVVVYADAQVDPSEWSELVRRESVNTAFLSNGFFDLWVRTLEGASGLRHLLVGGDVMNREAVRHLYALDPDVELINVYGPTEATTFSSYYPVDRSYDWERPVPIGRSLNNGYLRLLDEAMQAVPPGIVGELYVGGDGVATAYLNREQLTAERFVPDPWVPGGRLYRTGDRARWMQDGCVSFLGRSDNQVKVRGFRIELEEIRAAILATGTVETCVVTVFEPAPRDKRIRAHIVPKAGVVCTADSLRAALCTRLPDFMLPSRIVLLESLPLNANAKIDLAALPDGDEADPSRVHVAAEGASEQRIYEIWAALLASRDFGVTDDFFEVGGHSLLASRAVAEIERETRIRIPLRDFFEQPSVRAIAKLVDLYGFHTSAPVHGEDCVELGTL